MSKQAQPRVDLDVTRTRLETLGLCHGAEQLEQLLHQAVKQDQAPHALSLIHI